MSHTGKHDWEIKMGALIPNASIFRINEPASLIYGPVNPKVAIIESNTLDSAAASN